jgi:hypothetical protein
MLHPITFLAGAAAGYLVGARTGREGLERIKSFAADHEMPAPVEKAYRAATDRIHDLTGACEGSRDDDADNEASHGDGPRIPTPAELAENVAAAGGPR